jgi:ATP-dependent Clp protease ATP-binding subunit ClpX
VLAALSELDAPDLVRILTEPRNALFKQYQTMFALEGVDLIFTDQAVQAVARRAVSLRTGARALRAIMEDVMLELMYEVPANAQIRTVTITEDVINGHSAPEILTG